jgi:hypothetical protein
MNFTMEENRFEDGDSVTELFKISSSNFRIGLGIFLQIMILSSLQNRYYIFKFLSLSKSNHNTINYIFWFEQLSQLFYVFTSIIYSFALFSPVQLSQLLGNEFCRWVRIPSGIYICGCPIWSCIVAIFRLILLKGNSSFVRYLGVDKFAKGLIIIGIIIQTVCVSLLVFFDDTSFVTRMCFQGNANLVQVGQKYPRIC